MDGAASTIKIVMKRWKPKMLANKVLGNNGIAMKATL